MFNLRIVQADCGDCLIAEYGTPGAPRYIFIDRRPRDVFANHLEVELRTISAAGGKLDLVAISHVDSDHITGLLDLLATIRDQRVNGQTELIGIDVLWHNSFSNALDPDADIQTQLSSL